MFKKHPDLRTGIFADDLVDSMIELKDMLDITNREWPADFPMQDFIDYRSAQGERDPLPTSEELEEERSGREASDDVSEDAESEDAESEDDESDDDKSDDESEAGGE